MAALDRLEQFLLIALQSEQAGEVVAAVDAAKKQMAKQGIDPHMLASRLAGVEKPEQKQQRLDQNDDANQYTYDASDAVDPDFDSDVTIERLARWCLAKHASRLRRNEREFMDSMVAWVGDPTERQANWMASIVQRLRRGG